MVIRPVSKIVSLDNLLANITEDNLHSEVNSGATGREGALMRNTIRKHSRCSVVQ